MNALAVLDRPYMGQPLPDALPDVDVPLPAAPPAIETLPSADFVQRLHQQADMARQGNVTTDNFEEFWRVASQISYFDDGISEACLGPDGRELSGPDRDAAILLSNMRSADAWLLKDEADRKPLPRGVILEETELTADEVRFVSEIFGRYNGVCELDIPADELDQIVVARKRLCLTLGIADHNAYTLEQLIQKSAARLELHEAIIDGAFDALLRPTARLARLGAAARAISGQQLVVPESFDGGVFSVRLPVPGGSPAASSTGQTDALDGPPHPQPAVNGHELLQQDPAPLVSEIVWDESRWPADSSAPTRRRSEGIRSHRAERRMPRWLRRTVIALGAAALVGVTAATIIMAARGMLPWQSGPELTAALDAIPGLPLPSPPKTPPPLVEVPPPPPPPPAVNLDQFVWNVAHAVAPGQELSTIECAIEAARDQGYSYSIAFTSPDDYRILYDGAAMVGDQRTTLNQIIVDLGATYSQAT